MYISRHINNTVNIDSGIDHFLRVQALRLVAPLGAALLLLFFSGCRSTPQPETASPRPKVESALPAPDVVLGEGDELDIKFPFNHDLNESVTIRPDGKISLQIVDDVVAAGLTPAELDDVLTKLYSKQIRNPSLTVIVRKLANQRVFVGGEVNHPGVIPISGRMTVMDAILQAGGPDRESAKLSDIVVVRTVGRKRYAALLDLQPAFEGQPGMPFFLAPNDIVLVPQSGVSSVNQWIDQYINRMMPATYLRIQTKHGSTVYGYGR